MNGPFRANVIGFAILGLIGVVLTATLIAKARLAGAAAERENERRPRSMAVDPALPDWFRSLDKNNDAKVSRAEFIGTNEQFRRIDLNADGVISPAEAIAADEWFRSEIPP